jgi:lysozyme
MIQLKGIDVSRHQGEIDWEKVKADGVHFVFIKATQGVGYKFVDYFRNHAPKSLGFGLQVGAYHYGTFSTIPEAITEAKYFLSVVKDFKLTYPLVLDLEENKKNVSKKQLTDAANAFLDVLKNAKYQVILYTGKAFLETQLDEKQIHCPLWIARYGSELGRTADIWQHTSEGQVNGITGSVDMNIAYKEFAPKPIYKVGEIMLKVGDKGNLVKLLHNGLAALGYIQQADKDRDKYDQFTANKVAQFQQDQKLKNQSGIVDYNTALAFMQVLAVYHKEHVTK